MEEKPTEDSSIEFQDYMDESQLDAVMLLVTQDLSEPYSIFTYRYFLHRFPELCILAVDDGKPIGCVVCKIDQEEAIQNGEQRVMKTGYIGMLAVQSSYRRRGIGKALVRKVLERMKEMKCESVMLETEMSNVTAQKLYQRSFGFIREEKLVRYYLNWGDAYRLRLWF
mmetsp:Transcript_24362/g.59648  ORF Transcript_24362/g.59648 Transcript_24362/m.59648 type:complete len:168 (-) Transcript_24362:888-1391(-)|eukprot:CAMPEP_0113607254 /NCGR_PEP_ID=MMETSP0017_2-20120614/3286_1 /TAXON_ID=2856 /ORGANISM="Cylindrotheca closterium" /LENGTH=167 /DNA_ID=CAMNT_0000515845 /DNA_START=27 /DNA_END=530 /DNA_ORIENTATION=- /assembly_acc=CAM_ASM_000147